MQNLVFSALSLALPLFVCSSRHAQSERTKVALPPASSGEETSALIEEVRRAEYRFNPVKGEGEVWSAPSRGQELRSRVSSQGIEVFPRATSANGVGTPWKLTLTTTSFGRVDGAFPLPPASVRVRSERVELDHGYLVEWFVNEERGIEQGWTIPARPMGAGELSIGLALAGELTLRLEEGGRSGVFVDACGEAVLRYRNLRAFDATGRELEARLLPQPTGVAIEVDDAGAVYPLTVDPLLTGAAWTTESDQAGAFFGFSVSTAGDVNGDGYSDVIVGAYQYDNGQLNEGRAYVYHGSSGGLGASPAWFAESDQAGASFGISVSTAGDVNGDGYSDVIVGAYQYDTADPDAGRAYAYHGSSSGLGASPAWTTESNQAGALFGRSVSTAGDVNGDGFSDVIVGAPFHTNGQFQEGRAYAYLGSTSGLASSPAWNAEGNTADALFGFSVSTAGDVNGDGYSDVIVGVPNDFVGRAQAYHGSSSGLAASPAWTATLAQVDAFFGRSVATAGDVNGDGYSDVIVGAYLYDGGQADEGVAYAYLGSASGLAVSAAWTVESNQTGAAYGVSVSTAGDVNGDGYSDVIIGARSYDNGQSDEGRAYAYLGSPAGLATSPDWSAESDQAFAQFGAAVSSAGDVNGDGYSDVIVGAHLHSNGQSSEGRAFAYHGSPSGLSSSAAWGAESDQAGALFGVSVASAGDVNGDGYSDVIVGAYAYDNGQSDEGRAFVYNGTASGVTSTPSWTGESNQAGAFFGVAVSGAGDVNGDGYSDVIIGASDYDGGQTDEGRAYVYHGSPAGLGVSPAWTAESNQASARFGFAVADAGDVDGDGYGDLIVGAYLYDGGEIDEGRAFVYHGSPLGLSTSPAWNAESDQAGACFGISVSAAGDVNADGRSDVVVGAHAFDGGQTDEGRAYVYLGSTSGLGTSAAWMAESDQSGASFGVTTATAGDVNGDGYSDVVVGAYHYDGGQTDEGRAYVYLGSSTGLAASAAWTAEADQAGAFYASDVASAGDVNGDGYSDLIVGATKYDGDEVDEGRVYVYLGSASGLAPSPAWTVESNQHNSIFANSVACAGDVNGDGYSDVIVGQPYFDGGEGDEGRILVWLGNAGAGGLVHALQQRTRNDARPLAVVGLTGESGLFRIRCEFPKNPVSTAWASPESPLAHLEWEVKPLGVPFDGSGIQRGTEQSLLPAGGTLILDELASIDDAVDYARTTKARNYHWRARVATSNPLFPNTAWFGAASSNLSEAKFRKSRRESP